MRIALFIAVSLFSITLASRAQVDLYVAPQVEWRMAAAIQKARATASPSWCIDRQRLAMRNILIEKCLRTLYHNHLPANGGVLHEGVMPGIEVFGGLWAWDSWKHAFALARFDPELAKNSIRAMLDYQDSDGMVADCIFPDSKENNYRNTKPPLSAWAAWEVFRQTGDTAFIREVYPAILKYHAWWYRFRDHDGNGLCEYGSTDGTLEAARWESGWDNAIRFDSAGMLRNSDHAWSMDIESVDLNSYLYIEKENLARMAQLAGDPAQMARLERERKKLGEQIRSTFFDERSGFFYDVRMAGKTIIPGKEANGWLPLYAGIATPEQAARVREIMMREGDFNTRVPLPTASKSNPGFTPQRGYWRGPAWIDQFWFGYEGLKRYGYSADADALLEKLLAHAEGIASPDGSLRENYDPITGQGLNAQAFSWTAAHLLLLMTGGR